MARKQEPNDEVNFQNLEVAQLQALRQVATIQRSSMNKLQHQGIRVSHLLSIINAATGAMCALKGVTRGTAVVSEGDQWKSDAKNASQYDGGADAALDSLIAGAAMRLLQITEDKSEWSKIESDRMEENLVQWSEWQKMRAISEVGVANAQRRPCVLHTLELFNGARGLWYAVMTPFVADKSSTPVIGVGPTPVAAMDDFDRAFGSGELNPAAALWLEEVLEAQDKQSRANAKRVRARAPKKGTE